MSTPTRAGTTPWPPEAVRRYTELGYWEGRSLPARLGEVAATRPDAVCLVDGETRLTWSELMSRADGFATRLHELGLAADERVVLQLPNSWELIVAMVGCMRAAVVPVMALLAHRHQELSAVVAHAEARAIVTAGAVRGFNHEALAHELKDGCPTLEHVVVVADVHRVDSHDFHSACGPVTPAERARLDTLDPAGRDVALFFLSGGTTGAPKLIARTHDDVGYMVTTAAEWCEFDEGSTYLAALPLGHGLPMAGPGVLGALLAGGRAVIARTPAPEEVFALVAAERVTVTTGVPAVVQRWLEHRGVDTGTDLSSLRFVQVAGARLADDVARRVTPVLGCALQQGYGMGEGLVCLTRLDEPAEVVNRVQGQPISPADELLVLDEAGQPVAPGEAGVLHTRGPYTIRGYYRAPELNAKVFRDGWYCTGDIVRLLPDGNLVVDGRQKDVINRGGEKISAEEVEEFAYRCGAAGAAAVAMPDAELGERICLYVVGRGVTLADVRAAMTAAGAAHFKLPERLVAVAVLPVTAVGKTDKAALRADIARRLDTERAA